MPDPFASLLAIARRRLAASPPSPGDSDPANRPLVAAAALEAVEAAGLACREVQRTLTSGDTLAKGDRSPVTVADYASQAIVTRMLSDRLGDLVLVAEEDSTLLGQAEQRPVLEAVTRAVQSAWPGATADEVLKAIDAGGGSPGAEGFWTLDPLDGTKGFLRGGQYAVSLAWIEGASPVVGVLGCPNLAADQDAPLSGLDARGTLYVAVAGHGSFEIDLTNESAEPRPLSTAAREPGALRVCASVEESHSDLELTRRLLDHLRVPEHLIRLDSQCKYAVVARGQADAYLRLPTRADYIERIWDHAAGALVAREAGCLVTDIHGQPLDFAQGRGLERNTGVVCATSSVHGALSDAIATLGLAKASTEAPTAR